MSRAVPSSLVSGQWSGEWRGAGSSSGSGGDSNMLAHVEGEYTRVPVKFIDDLSHRIEKLQYHLKRKQRILSKVRLSPVFVMMVHVFW